MNLHKMLSAAIALLVFAIIALAVAGTDAWQESGAGEAEDMDTLVVALFTDHVIPKAFVNTLIISSGSTILATLLGVSLAWVNARTNCPGRDVLEHAAREHPVEKQSDEKQRYRDAEGGTDDVVA